MGRGSYLDCGCYIDTEGHRTWCPTCSAESLPPSRAEQELAALRARLAEAVGEAALFKDRAAQQEEHKVAAQDLYTEAIGEKQALETALAVAEGRLAEVEGDRDRWRDIVAGMPCAMAKAGAYTPCGTCDPCRARAERAGAQVIKDVPALYHELLYQVCRVFPGETRHETALRYIREAENRACVVGSDHCLARAAKEGQ